LLKSKKEAEILLNSLQISYTEFFRNSLTFSLLEHVVLPGMLLRNHAHNNKEIRIWSAACSTGQEAYSLAMILEELQNGKSKKANYRIFATDHCKSKIDEAKKGIYSMHAIKNLKLKQINQWFDIQGDFYAVKQDLKRNIDFSVFDLFDNSLSVPPASIFGDFDLVFCSNLLYYYNNEYIKNILDKVCKSMVKGGYLITGEAEQEILLKHNFYEVYPQSAIFQK
jgi:chemotaxis methyl-accepting protein methylase